MLNSIMTEGITIEGFLFSIVVSIGLGLMLAIVHSFSSYSSKGLVITIAILPSVVCMVILLVNGNLGAGVAVAGAFSLVRFRSMPGSAREINSIFMAMAIGLATGMGYIGMAVCFAVLISVFNVLMNISKLGEWKGRQLDKELRMTVPESLDYTGIFDDIFDKYTKKVELVKVKTSNMGSLYKLQYNVTLKVENTEKEMIDELRCRNGNLEIMCSKRNNVNEEL